jgi:hypothetical protein
MAAIKSNPSPTAQAAVAKKPAPPTTTRAGKAGGGQGGNRKEDPKKPANVKSDAQGAVATGKSPGKAGEPQKHTGTKKLGNEQGTALKAGTSTAAKGTTASAKPEKTDAQGAVAKGNATGKAGEIHKDTETKKSGNEQGAASKAGALTTAKGTTASAKPENQTYAFFGGGVFGKVPNFIQQTPAAANPAADKAATAQNQPGKNPAVPNGTVASGAGKPGESTAVKPQNTGLPNNNTAKLPGSPSTTQNTAPGQTVAKGANAPAQQNSPWANLASLFNQFISPSPAAVAAPAPSQTPSNVSGVAGQTQSGPVTGAAGANGNPVTVGKGSQKGVLAKAANGVAPKPNTAPVATESSTGQPVLTASPKTAEVTGQSSTGGRAFATAAPTKQDQFQNFIMQMLGGGGTQPQNPSLSPKSPTVSSKPGAPNANASAPVISASNGAGSIPKTPVQAGAVSTPVTGKTPIATPATPGNPAVKASVTGDKALNSGASTPNVFNNSNLSTGTPLFFGALFRGPSPAADLGSVFGVGGTASGLNAMKGQQLGTFNPDSKVPGKELGLHNPDKPVTATPLPNVNPGGMFALRFMPFNIA